MSNISNLLNGIQCEYCSMSFNNHSACQQHSQICSKALVLCPFHKVGCTTQIRRESIREHITSLLNEHLKLLADYPWPTTNQTTTSTITHQDNNSLSNELTRQAQIIEQLCIGQKSLLSNDLKREQELARTCVNVQLLKGEICELKKQLELTTTLTDNDGTYLWRITNLHELFRNAKNSTQSTYITSPPFYTSKSGYKLALRAYLHGDKSVRDAYLSLYITVMSGDYDSLLKWPFNYPITLCLFDRSSKQDHVVHTLTPDINSVCFQQPRMAANKSAGIPEFCPLWKVFSKDFGYVRQDEMYIKAFVDYKIFPTNIWPKWVELQSNGYPIHIEHIKLDELINKVE